jgi:drug/metabolite transporter (DMT)-like permease
MGKIGYALAVLAAVANATAELLQRKANQREPESRQMSARLILDLLKRPIWLAGIVAVTLGFILQAAALSRGALAIVEPILVVELPLTLIGASHFLGSKLRRREWISIGIMTVGIIGLIPA